MVVVLTDCLLSASRSVPSPSPQAESLLEYFETFSCSLNHEDTVFEQVMEESVGSWLKQHPTLFNLDLYELERMAGQVWEMDETKWLGDLLGELDGVDDLESVDVSEWEKLVHDMKSEQVMHDMDWGFPLI